MNDLLGDLCVPGNIIGLGESTHGSATEFMAKYDAILNIARNYPDLPVTFYFEAYSEPFEKLELRFDQDINADISSLVRECLAASYSVWQTKEIYDFLHSLVVLRAQRSASIRIIGVDYKNKAEKKSIDTSYMLANRARIMFENIRAAYKSDSVHVFSAHNGHIGKYADETGALLGEEYGPQYIAVAQYVYRGEVRAKNPKGDYSVTSFSHEPKVQTLAHVAQKYFAENITSSSVVWSAADSRLEDAHTMSQIGYFWPLEKPWYAPFGSELFDYVVLHARSMAAQGFGEGV